MKKIVTLVFIFIGYLSSVFGQEFKFNFLPDSLDFQPLKANHQEPRLGVLYYPENGHLKVDVGNSIDVFQFSFSSMSRLRLGIQFMAYALSTNYQGKRLQIDAIDGFFGGYVSYRKNDKSSKIKARFRIIHNSAHFVDGHYDIDEMKWKNDLPPIPFTQDFGELTVVKANTNSTFSTVYYGSAAYSTLVRPALIKKWWFSCGFEFYSSRLFDKIFEHESNLFLAAQLRLAGMPKYQLSYNSLLGVKFGEWEGKGVTLYLSYYYGNDVFSEYYYRRSSEFGIGFTVDFI